MILTGVPPDVYGGTTWTETVMWLGIAFLISALIFSFLYLFVKPWWDQALELEKKCHKCPEGDKARETGPVPDAEEAADNVEGSRFRDWYRGR